MNIYFYFDLIEDSTGRVKLYPVINLGFFYYLWGESTTPGNSLSCRDGGKVLALISAQFSTQSVLSILSHSTLQINDFLLKIPHLLS